MVALRCTGRPGDPATPLETSPRAERHRPTRRTSASTIASPVDRLHDRLRNCASGELLRRQVEPENSSASNGRTLPAELARRHRPTSRRRNPAPSRPSRPSNASYDASVVVEELEVDAVDEAGRIAAPHEAHDGRHADSTMRTTRLPVGSSRHDGSAVSTASAARSRTSGSTTAAATSPAVPQPDLQQMGSITRMPDNAVASPGGERLVPLDELELRRRRRTTPFPSRPSARSRT